MSGEGVFGASRRVDLWREERVEGGGKGARRGTGGGYVGGVEAGGGVGLGGERGQREMRLRGGCYCGWVRGGGVRRGGAGL